MRLSRILILTVIGGALVVSAAAQEGQKPSAQGPVSSFPPPQSQYPTYSQSQEQDYPAAQRQRTPDYPPSADYNPSQARDQSYPQSQSQDQNYPPTQSQDRGYPPASQDQGYPAQSQYPSYPQSQGQGYPPPQDQNYPQSQSQDQNYPPAQDQGYPASQSQYPNYPQSQGQAYPQSQDQGYPQSQDQNYPPAQDRNYPPPQSQDRSYPPQAQYPSSESQYPQQQEQYPPYSQQQEQYPQQGQGYPPPPVQTREWVPQGIGALGQYATGRTEFTLDHSMLVLATKMDRDNDDLRRVVAGVNGVSVHSFRFAGRVSCDPVVMSMINEQYRGAGFQHLVSQRRRDAGGVGTDLWLRMDHGAVTDIAVLFAGERQLNFVSVSGSISPLELLHLSGHFGIPRMDGGMAVPVPYGDKHHDRDRDRARDGYQYR
jgi:Domain of unknown function (DUF4252)